MTNLTEYNQFRTSSGRPPLAPSYNYKKQRGLNMSDKGWEGLRQLSIKLGYSSITAFLEALGHNLWQLSIYTNDE